MFGRKLKPKSNEKDTESLLELEYATWIRNLEIRIEELEEKIKELENKGEE